MTFVEERDIFLLEEIPSCLVFQMKEEDSAKFKVMCLISLSLCHAHGTSHALLHYLVLHGVEK